MTTSATSTTIHSSASTQVAQTDLTKGLASYTAIRLQSLASIDPVAGISSHDSPIISSLIKAGHSWKSLLTKDSTALTRINDQLTQADKTAAKNFQ